MHLARPSFHRSDSASATLPRCLLLRLSLALTVAGTCLAAAPSRALAQSVTFNYGTSLSDPQATDGQLGTFPQASVTLTDRNDRGNGVFSMFIEPLFSPESLQTSGPSITQLAFNVQGFQLNVTSFEYFPVLPPGPGFCEPGLPGSTICNGSFGLFYGLNSVGVKGAGNVGLNRTGFDLLIDLPTEEPKLDTSQKSITLYIKGPNGFGVDSFARACSKDAPYEQPDPELPGSCSAGSFETMVKVQELNTMKGTSNNACFGLQPRIQKSRLGGGTARFFARFFRLNFKENEPSFSVLCSCCQVGSTLEIPKKVER